MTDITSPEFVSERTGKFKLTAYLRSCFAAGEGVRTNDLLAHGVTQSNIYATISQLRTKDGLTITTDRVGDSVVYHPGGSGTKPSGPRKRETPAEAGRRMAQTHMQEVLAQREAEASVALDGETQSVDSWPLPTPVVGNGLEVPPLGTVLTVAGAYLDEDGALQLALRNGAGNYLVRLIGHT